MSDPPQLPNFVPLTKQQVCWCRTLAFEETTLYEDIHGFLQDIRANFWSDQGLELLADTMVKRDTRGALVGFSAF